ncbi:hypothetical protein AHiyo4_43110 [Arthrobacter sp. Hiyo4]|nr:hypothetical protein AHiyo4_43110 [Arthrobacter sp. Hiyo4]
MPHALKDGVRSVAAAELAHLLDAGLAALGDDVGGTVFEAQIGAGLVPAHQDDLLGTELPGGQHRHQPDGAVTDDRDSGPGVDACLEGGVVAGAVDVGEGQQRRQQLAVPTHRDLDQGAVGERDADGLGLGAADSVRGPEPAVAAGGLQAFAAEDAGTVGPGERGDDEVPFFRVDTSLPVSSTTPMNSWPMGLPCLDEGMPW